MTAFDVHQHLWTAALLEALAERTSPPLARRAGAEWMLQAPGEPSWTVGDPRVLTARRLSELRRDGTARALVCLSSPMGIEALPRDEAEPLIDAYHDGVSELPAAFGFWGAIALAGAGADDVDAALARGAVGLSLPAGALADAAGAERCLPLLERLGRRGAPLLLHPGPAPWRPARDHDPGSPLWWPALTGYVADMQAAWLTVLTRVRPVLPDLPVVFAMLAGLAPLHAERLVARGGPAPVVDPLTFYDTSSYGAVAITAVARKVGAAQLVHGTDRPVVEPERPRLTPELELALRVANPERLLTELAVAA